MEGKENYNSYDNNYYKYSISLRPVPTYTWKKDGFTVSSSDQIMFEQDSRVIVISNITSTDSGLYTCQAKQDNTFLYYNASLVVKGMLTSLMSVI